MNKKSILTFLLILFPQFSFGYIVSLNDPVEGNAIVPLVNSAGVQWKNDLSYLTYIVPDELGSFSYRTYPFTGISVPGFYRLANNVSNQITISASNVTLDLNGHTVSGGVNGIVVSGNSNNITIKNGTISSVTTDGIQINGGCRDITIQELAIKNGLRGIHIENTINALVRNCDMSSNTTGIEIDGSHNVYVENCSAMTNVQAGYSLLSSTTCSFFDCKAVSTGQGNSNSLGDESFVFGFVSQNGTGNIFENCIASGTENLNATDFQTVIAGIALKTGEECSKIVGCEAGNAQCNGSGFTIPYGIFLENSFASFVTVTEYDTENTSDINNVSWTPDGKYVAVGGQVNGNTGFDIILFTYDWELNRLTVADRQAHGAEVQRIEWSPSGRFLGIAGSTSGSTEVRIFALDRTNNRLILRDNIDVGVRADALDWSADERFIAVGNISSGATQLKIYEFDPVNEIAVLQDSVSQGDPDTVQEAKWSGDFLAIASNADASGIIMRIYELNRSTKTISQVATQTRSSGSISSALGIDWSPNGKFLGLGENGGASSQFRVFRFDRDDNTLTELDQVTLPALCFDVAWITDSLVAIENDNGSGAQIRLYQFNQVDTLTELDSTSISATESQGINWSPDGTRLAVADINGVVTILSGLEFPEKNVLQNNKTYCNRGNRDDNGIGIFGSSISNMMIGNSSFGNPANYQLVTNVFNQLFGNGPIKLQNTSFTSNIPLQTTQDFPAKLRRLEFLAESLIDNLL